MRLRRAVQESPNCDGVVLGGHGLFTWGNTQQECYAEHDRHHRPAGALSWTTSIRRVRNYSEARNIGPRKTGAILHLIFFSFLRSGVPGMRRVIGSFSDLPEVLRFVNSNQ